jgi:hypothetical protein
VIAQKTIENVVSALRHSGCGGDGGQDERDLTRKPNQRGYRRAFAQLKILAIKIESSAMAPPVPLLSTLTSLTVDLRLDRDTTGARRLIQPLAMLSLLRVQRMAVNNCPR